MIEATLDASYPIVLKACIDTGYNRNARRGGQRHYAGEPAYRQIERRFAGRPS